MEDDDYSDDFDFDPGDVTKSPTNDIAAPEPTASPSHVTPPIHNSPGAPLPSVQNTPSPSSQLPHTQPKSAQPHSLNIETHPAYISLAEENKDLRERLDEYRIALDAMRRAQRSKEGKRRLNAPEVRDFRLSEKQGLMYKREAESLRRQIEKCGYQLERVVQLENQLTAQRREQEEVLKENKALKRVLHDQERALQRNDQLEDNMPRLVASMNTDIRVLKDQVKRYHERHSEDQHSIRKMQTKIIRMTERSKDLREQLAMYDGQPKPAAPPPQADPRDIQIEELKMKLRVQAHSNQSAAKRHRMELNQALTKIEALRNEVVQLTQDLKEKDKELKIVISNRGGRVYYPPRRVPAARVDPLPRRASSEHVVATGPRGPSPQPFTAPSRTRPTARVNATAALKDLSPTTRRRLAPIPDQQPTSSRAAPSGRRPRPHAQASTHANGNAAPRRSARGGAPGARPARRGARRSNARQIAEPPPSNPRLAFGSPPSQASGPPRSTRSPSPLRHSVQQAESPPPSTPLTPPRPRRGTTPPHLPSPDARPSPPSPVQPAPEPTPEPEPEAPPPPPVPLPLPVPVPASEPVTTPDEVDEVDAILGTLGTVSPPNPNASASTTVPLPIAGESARPGPGGTDGGAEDEYSFDDEDDEEEDGDLFFVAPQKPLLAAQPKTPPQPAAADPSPITEPDPTPAAAPVPESEPEPEPEPEPEEPEPEPKPKPTPEPAQVTPVGGGNPFDFADEFEDEFEDDMPFSIGPQKTNDLLFGKPAM